LEKFEIGPGHAYWDQENVFDEKKTGHEKSRDTVPLRTYSLIPFQYFYIVLGLI
jgi:hypothetical protein